MKTGGRINTELFYHLFYVTKERKRTCIRQQMTDMRKWLMYVVERAD